MKIVNTANGVQTNASTSNFNIEMNGKAFKALFSDIYSNKIGAVVREVGSNCADAHKMIGKENVPFKIVIHEDISKESSIKFIDEGIGMSKNQIEHLYTSFFSSNKDTNNDCIGGFGVGSKSPLAYTDRFIVESIKDGLKNVALIVNIDNQPQYSLILEDVETTEKSGTTVKIAIETKDVDKFLQESYHQFRNFKPAPIIEHNTGKTYDVKKPIFENDDFIIFGCNSSARNVYDATLVIDGITYEYSSNTLLIEKSLVSIFDIALKFKTGDFEVALSREYVVSNDSSKEKITNKLLMVNEFIESNFSNVLFDVLSNYNLVKLVSSSYWVNKLAHGEAIGKVEDLYFSKNQIYSNSKGIVYFASTNNSITSSNVIYDTKSNMDWLTYYSYLFENKSEKIVFTIDANIKDKRASIINIHKKLMKLDVCKNKTVIYVTNAEDNPHTENLIAYMVNNKINYVESNFKTYRKDFGIQKAPRKPRAATKRIPLNQLDSHCIPLANQTYRSNFDVEDERYIDLSIFGKEDFCFITRSTGFSFYGSGINTIIDYTKDMYKKMHPNGKIFIARFTPMKFNDAMCYFSENIKISTSEYGISDEIIQYLLTRLTDEYRQYAMASALRTFLYKDLCADVDDFERGFSYKYFWSRLDYSESEEFVDFIHNTARIMYEDIGGAADKRHDILYTILGYHILRDKFMEIIKDKFPLLINKSKIIDNYISEQLGKD